MTVNNTNLTYIPSTAEECLQIAVVQGAGGELMSGLWYVGVLMSIVSSIASNLGVNVQKMSMMNEIRNMNADPEYKEKPYIFQKMWLIGLLLVIAGSIGDFAALGFAAQSLATPVGGFTMVANVFFAHFFLKEHLGRGDMLATFLVVAGVVMVAASADKTEKTYTLECLLLLYQRTIFIVYVVGMVLLIGVMFFFVRWLNKLREIAPDSDKYKRWRKMHPIFPAALSGLIGAQSVLFAKCSAELIKSTVEGENQFVKWETYLIMVCMCLTIFNQLHWLATGLRYFDAVLIIPVFQCFFITGGVVGGGVFFDEFSNLQVWEQALFAAGVGTTILGVFLLSQREEPNETKVVPEGVASSGAPVIGDETRPSSESRPSTPLPMSLQYHSLAMSDVYNAFRESLSTPDRGARRTNSRGGSRIPSGNLEPHAEEAARAGKTVDQIVVQPLDGRPSGASGEGRRKRGSSSGPAEGKRRKFDDEVKKAW